VVEVDKPIASRARWVPLHLHPVAMLATLDLVALSAARLAFWLAFRGGHGPSSWGDLARAFYLGAKFDLRLVLLLVAPLALLGGTRSLAVASERGRRVWGWYLALTAVALCLFYGFDFGFYAYLRSRLAATALDFLVNPLISGRMVWESYPVVWAIVGIALLSLGRAWLFRVLVRRAEAKPRPAAGGWRRRVAIAACVVLWLGGVYGKLSWYPLRWSDAFFSTEDFVSAIALNPVIYFFDTFKNRTAGFDVEAVRHHYDRVAEYLGVGERDAATLRFTREERPTAQVGARPNIVVILLESYAYYKCSLSGNPLPSSPRLDEVATSSLLWRRFYVPSFGTARSVFALLTGIPDVETHETSTRNPLIVRQRTIVNALSGYERFYFLGGSLNWGNIRGVLMHNIPGLHVVEEGDFAAERVDVWGIPDIALFEAANAALRQVTDRPFFAVIQTSGNHRPYTIPKHSRGYQLVRHSDEELRAGGFISNEELNSFRLVDHSLGIFLDDARRERYFANTIFVILGDHGYQGRTAHAPPVADALGLTRLHVPFVIYAPGLGLAPRVVDTVASELDVLPTLASLTGTPYVNTTLGRDLFDQRFSEERFAFAIDDHFTKPRIGLISEDFFFRSYADGAEPQLYALTGPQAGMDVAAAQAEVAGAMAELCQGLFQTARYMLYHNAPSAGTDAPQAGRGVVPAAASR